MVKDPIIKTLVIETDREEHIAKHKISINEVMEIISGDYVYIKGREGKWLLIGKTKEGRYLTIVVGPREKKGVYGLVTARPASKEERSFYSEFILQKGDEQSGKN